MNLHLAILLVPLMIVDASEGGVRSLGMWLVAALTLCCLFTESCCRAACHNPWRQASWIALLVAFMSIVNLLLLALAVLAFSFICSLVWIMVMWYDLGILPCLLGRTITSSWFHMHPQLLCRAWGNSYQCYKESDESSQSWGWADERRLILCTGTCWIVSLLFCHASSNRCHVI